jgi:RNA polymerase sigma-70 factor (ECF subfamily)
MLRARRHWDRIGTFEKPGTWVRRVTINLSLNQRRGIAREARTRLAWWERHVPAEQPQALDPDLLDALHALSPHQRAAIALHYLEDRSTPEIADLLGCTESTARVHLHRGRQALAHHLGAPR